MDGLMYFAERKETKNKQSNRLPRMRYWLHTFILSFTKAYSVICEIKSFTLQNRILYTVCTEHTYARQSG